MKNNSKDRMKKLNEELKELEDMEAEIRLSEQVKRKRKEILKRKYGIILSFLKKVFQR